MNILTKTPHTCQQESPKEKRHQEFVGELSKLVSPLTPCDKLVLTRLNNDFDYNNGVSRASQLVIAEELGISPRTVYRAIRKLVTLDLIEFYGQQGFNQTCLYKRPAWITDRVRFRLSKLCAAFAWAVAVPFFCSSLDVRLLEVSYIYKQFLVREVTVPAAVPRGITMHRTSSPFSFYHQANQVLPNVVSHPTKKIVPGTVKQKPDHDFEKRISMKHFQRIVENEENFVPQSVTNQELKDVLGLTKYGQFKLAIFPDECLRHALTQIKKKKSSLTSPFKYFLSICYQWCKEHRLHPDHDYYRRMAIAYHIPEDALLERPELIKAPPREMQLSSSKAVSSSAREKIARLDQEAEQRRKRHYECEERDERDPYGAALCLEQGFHELDIKAQQYFENPWLLALPIEQQYTILDTVHNKCSCNITFLASRIKEPRPVKQTQQEFLQGFTS